MTLEGQYEESIDFAIPQTLKDRVGITPSELVVSVFNQASNDENTPITIADSGVFAPKNFRLFERVRLKMFGEIRFLILKAISARLLERLEVMTNL